LGGSGAESLIGVVYDQFGRTVVSGRTTSPDFVDVPIDEVFGDAFVAWMDEAVTSVGTVVVVGGAGFDLLTSMVVHPSGDLVLTGLTRSIDFPLVRPIQDRLISAPDAFIVRLAPSGEIRFSTLIGGAGDDRALAVAVNPLDGSYHVVGFTTSSDLPAAADFESVYQGGVSDGFISSFSSDDELVGFEFLGGTDRDEAFGAAVDLAGRLHVVGRSSSADFPILESIEPTALGMSDGFVARFSAEGELEFATFIGGSRGDGLNHVVVPELGRAVVVGYSGSFDFPIRGTFSVPPGDNRGSGAVVVGVSEGRSNECAFIVDDMGDVLVLDITRRRVVGTIETGTTRDTLPDLIVSKNGATLFVLNAAVLPVPLGQPASATPSGQFDDALIAIDTASFQAKVIAELPGLTPGAAILAESSDGTEVYAANVDRMIQVMDSLSLDVEGVIPLWPVGGIDTANDGTVMYVSERQSDPVLRQLSIATKETLETVSLPPGSSPGKLKVSADNRRVYVVGRASADLMVFATSPLRLLQRIAVGIAPEDLAVGERSHRAYVGHGGRFGSVDVVDLGRGDVIERLHMEYPVNRVALTQDETLLLAATEGGRIFVIETRNHNLIDVVSTRLGGVGRVAMAIGIVPTGCGGDTRIECHGDCDGNGRVTVSELITAVNVSLGLMDLGICRAVDRDNDGVVSVGELVGAVGHASAGC
jgi:hypothetical protein